MHGESVKIFHSVRPKAAQSKEFWFMFCKPASTPASHQPLSGGIEPRSFSRTASRKARLSLIKRRMVGMLSRCAALKGLTKLRASFRMRVKIQGGVALANLASVLVEGGVEVPMEGLDLQVSPNSHEHLLGMSCQVDDEVSGFAFWLGVGTASHLQRRESPRRWC